MRSVAVRRRAVGPERVESHVGPLIAAFERGLARAILLFDPVGGHRGERRFAPPDGDQTRSPTSSWPSASTILTRAKWPGVKARGRAGPRPPGERGDGASRAEAGARVPEVHDAIDLRGLPSRTPLEGEGRILAGAVHEHLHLRADPLGVQLPGDAVLALLHAGGALGRDLRWHLVGKGRRRRAFLRRVREGAQAIEADVLEKLQQALHRGLRFAREAEEHGRAHGEPGNGLAKGGDDLTHAARGDAAAHGAQDRVVGVLDRHVEIRHHPRA